MKKYAMYRAERENGLTYQQIADKYGVSKQNVQQACGKYQPKRFRYFNEKHCIYVNFRKWLNDNNITCSELIRRIGWEPVYENHKKIRKILCGMAFPRKPLIDKLIEITGLPYEQLFALEETEC